MQGDGKLNWIPASLKLKPPVIVQANKEQGVQKADTKVVEKDLCRLSRFGHGECNDQRTGALH